MNAITKIAESIGYNNVDILPLLFNNINLFKDADVKIYNALIDIMKGLPCDKSHEFKTSTALTSQFLHQDCYIVAEYLLYLFHGNEDLTVSYVHIEKFVSVHGLIKVNYLERDFYIDGGGVYNNLTDILNRYELNINDLVINYYSGEQVIEDADNEQVCKLSDLTQTKHLLQKVNDHLNMGSYGDLEDSVIQNILMSFLGLD